jgi:hypothetical protein
MATRMQQRRGTASQWVSTNAGAGPILNAGEIGWESDTNKFKIGDGVNNWSSLDYFADINSTVNPAFGTSITFEGATADSYETTLQVTDPTADRTITLPNVTGTVITTGNLSDITDIGVFTSTITMEGSSADDFELTLSAGNPTADRTITFPDATGTVALTTDIAAGTVTETGTQTLTNKSISLGSNTVTSTLAQLNTAVSDADVASLAGSETLTNKTLTSPKINEDVAVTATATELNLIDGSVAGTVVNSKAVVYGSAGEVNATTLQIAGTSLTATATELNYVDGVTSAIQTQMDAKAPLAGPALTGDASAVNLTISGNLTVNGTTTNINSTNLVVEDKNIILADVETPTDTTADGGGITLKGATDKTFNWVDATDSWTSSEHINLASGKSLYLNGTLLKDVSETLTNKTLTTPVISSISNTGTLTLPTDTDTLVGRATTDTLTNKTLGSAVATTAFTLNATAELRLADTDSSHYVGFKAPGTVSANKIWTLPAADGAAGQVLTTDGSGVFSFSTPAAGAAFSELMLIGA